MDLNENAFYEEIIYQDSDNETDELNENVDEKHNTKKLHSRKLKS